MARFLVLVLALAFVAVVASADDSDSAAGVLTAIAKSPLPFDAIAAYGPLGNKGDESEVGNVGAAQGEHSTDSVHDSATPSEHKSDAAAAAPFVAASVTAAAISVASYFMF